MNNNIVKYLPMNSNAIASLISDIHVYGVPFVNLNLRSREATIDG